MLRSTVLLPEPLPPIKAKIDPRRMENVMLDCTTLVPNAKVRSTQRSNAPASGSDADDIGAYREHRIQADDTDNAGHHRAGRRIADIGCAAAGGQADLAARKRDEGPETDPLGEADVELRGWNGGLQLDKERRRRQRQHRECHHKTSGDAD